MFTVCAAVPEQEVHCRSSSGLRMCPLPPPLIQVWKWLSQSSHSSSVRTLITPHRRLPLPPLPSASVRATCHHNSPHTLVPLICSLLFHSGGPGHVRPHKQRPRPLPLAAAADGAPVVGRPADDAAGAGQPPGAEHPGQLQPAAGPAAHSVQPPDTAAPAHKPRGGRHAEQHRRHHTGEEKIIF